MCVLSAQTIRNYCMSDKPLISPFNERSLSFGKSYGLSAAGYDIRLARTIYLTPGRKKLAHATEYFDLPHHITGLLINKSTIARTFLDSSRSTNMEPGWRGFLTLEITNDSDHYLKIPAGSPIVMIRFDFLDEPTEQPYGDFDKYQNQPARPVPPILVR